LKKPWTLNDKPTEKSTDNNSHYKAHKPITRMFYYDNLIDPYTSNFERYCIEVGSFFETQCIIQQPVEHNYCITNRNVTSLNSKKWCKMVHSLAPYSQGKECHILLL